MNDLQENTTEDTAIKKSFCYYVAMFFSKLYEWSRPCNPVRKIVQKKLQEYEKNEQDIKVVKRELPRVKSFVDVLKEENSGLRKGVNLCLDDLEFVYDSLMKGDISSAIELLEQYPFAKKIKNKG
jgi:hypothetical protein